MESDIQANQLAVDVAFSARVLRDMVTMLKDDLRNLTNSKLSSYHPIDPKLSDDSILERKDTSAAWRAENGLNPVSDTEFIRQMTATQASSQFVDVLSSAGLENEYVEDLTGDEVTVNDPYQDVRAAFIYAESVRNSVSAPIIKTVLENDPILSEQVYLGAATKHLIEADPLVLADNDPLIFANLNRTLDYVRQALR